MNCKPGDLAIVVYSTMGESVGKILRCIRFVGEVPGWHGDDQWETDLWGQGTLGGWDNHWPDSWLRPLRDNDGEDETLTWVGKPSDIKTPEAA